MTPKTFLAIIGIVAVLYGLGFLLIPEPFNALYGIPPEPHTTLYTRLFGSALVGVGVVEWLAKDFRDWDAVRAVLIANVPLTAIGGLVVLYAVLTGLANALAWTSVLVYALILIGSLYCLMQGEKKAS